MSDTTNAALIAEAAWDAAVEAVVASEPQWAETAIRLMKEGEHEAAARYFDYASARRSVAAELKGTNPYRANPEPKEGE